MRVKRRRSFLERVKQDGSELRLADMELRADKDIVLAAVTQNGETLKFAAEEHKADREIVLAAVTQNGFALLYAATDLKADREIVLVAVTQNRRALLSAATELRADREIVLAALFAPDLYYVPLYQYIAIDLWGDEQIALRLFDMYRDELPLSFYFCFVQKYSHQMQ